VQPHSSNVFNDLDAEFTLAWICVNDHQAIGNLGDLLDASEFSDPLSAQVWTACAAASKSSAPFDKEIAIATIAATTPGVDSAALRASLDQMLALSAGTASEAEWCAWRVRVAALTRELLTGLESVRAALVAGEDETTSRLLDGLLERSDRLIEARRRATEALDRLNMNKQ
jgi:replicative DNA helicase